MKKFALLLAFIIVLSTMAVSAVSVGDKISEAVYSDLSVYINHYPIPAYVVNDYAVIVAEDLANYCCDVVWNGENRTLNISPSADKNEFADMPVYKTTMPTGTVYSDVLYTDIKTFVNGNEITSFNVNGRTMIVIDEFGRNIGEYAWADDIRAAKAWISGKPVKDYAPVPYRTETLFLNDNYSWTENFTGSYDFDFDGTQEPVRLDIEYGGNYQTMSVSIGSRTTSVDVFDAGIEAVYACDIDKTDGHKDLVVITSEYSADPYIRIFKYDDTLSRYGFQIESWFDGKISTEYDRALGYANKYYFNVNDDDTLTIEENTESPGMWDVYKTLYRDDYNIFVELKPSYYTVLPNFMTDRQEFYPEIDAYEKSMWYNGYIKANQTYSSNGFTIYSGEYFKVVYDDGNSCLFIEKQNGQSGWIYIDYNMYKVNPNFFYLAG